MSVTPPSALAQLFQSEGWRARSRRLRPLSLPGGALLFETGGAPDEVFFLNLSLIHI